MLQTAEDLILELDLTKKPYYDSNNTYKINFKTRSQC